MYRDTMSENHTRLTLNDRTSSWGYGSEPIKKRDVCCIKFWCNSFFTMWFLDKLLIMLYSLLQRVWAFNAQNSWGNYDTNAFFSFIKTARFRSCLFTYIEPGALSTLFPKPSSKDSNDETLCVNTLFPTRNPIALSSLAHNIGERGDALSRFWTDVSDDPIRVRRRRSGRCHTDCRYRPQRTEHRL